MSNGGGGYNTAFFAPGGPGYTPYADPVPPAPVYTGTDPVIYSTDTPALIPQQPANDPVWFDINAPLDFTGMNFPDEAVSSPAPITSPPLIFDWEAPLDFGGLSFPDVPYAYPSSYIPEPISEGIVFPLGPVSPEISAPAEFNWEDPVWFDWQAPLVTEGLAFADEPGPLESIWKFAGDVVKGIGDVAKFVVDNLDVGVSYRGDYGGVKTQKVYYSTVGAPAPVILGMPGGVAPSVRQSVTTGGAGGGPGGGPPMTEEERLYREALGQTQADSDKFIMYAAGAYLAYRVFLK